MKSHLSIPVPNPSRFPVGTYVTAPWKGKPIPGRIVHSAGGDRKVELAWPRDGLRLWPIGRSDYYTTSYLVLSEITRNEYMRLCK